MVVDTKNAKNLERLLNKADTIEMMETAFNVLSDINKIKSMQASIENMESEIQNLEKNLYEGARSAFAPFTLDMSEDDIAYCFEKASRRLKAMKEKEAKKNLEEVKSELSPEQIKKLKEMGVWFDDEEDSHTDDN